LAAYFNLDVTLVRILFILLTVLTHGGFIAAYALCVIFIPEAGSPRERAQAYGAAPVTANDLIRQAQETYDRLRSSSEWKKGTHEMRSQMKEWKKQWKQQRRAQHRMMQDSVRSNRPSPFWEVVQSILGMVWVFFIGYVGWFLYTHVPGFHAAVDAAAAWIAHLFHVMAAAIDAKINS
jgi:hypothetical protein